MSSPNIETFKDTKKFNEFNGNISKLFKAIKKIKSDKKAGKLYVDALSDKIIKLIRVDNTEPMKQLGPMIFANRAEIQNKNLKFFINKDYIGGLKEIGDKHNFTQGDYKDANDAIEYIKDIAVMSNIDQQNEIFDIMGDMLSTYVDYLISLKNNS